MLLPTFEAILQAKKSDLASHAAQKAKVGWGEGWGEGWWVGIGGMGQGIGGWVSVGWGGGLVGCGGMRRGMGGRSMGSGKIWAGSKWDLSGI